jgi:hypothetical protein
LPGGSDIDFILTFYEGAMGPTAGGCGSADIPDDRCSGIHGAVLKLVMEPRSSISTSTDHGAEVGTRFRCSNIGLKKMKYVVGNWVNARVRLMTILVGFEATIVT